jgi:hypothetical protein
MITVWVDRDSVAMGDDVESHEVAWQFEDHACPGDVLDRAITEHYLASVAGDVAWTLEVGRFEVEPRDGYTSVRGVATHSAAVLVVPMLGSPSVLALNSYSLMQPFASAPERAVAERMWAVNFRYASGGAPRSARQFRDWLRDDERRRRGITAPS